MVRSTERKGWGAGANKSFCMWQLVKEPTVDIMASKKGLRDIHVHVHVSETVNQHRSGEVIDRNIPSIQLSAYGGPFKTQLQQGWQRIMACSWILCSNGLKASSMT